LGGAESEKQPNILEVLLNICTVRGIYVGSRAQFEDMNRAIEVNDIHPVVDKKQFQLTELKEAVQYMQGQEHLGKICIKID
jgi:NADPH:quinone reductase-like Zn-dependent oxidoreductase